MVNTLSIQEFCTRFKTEEDCLNYLIEIKWGKGYKCIKCGEKEYGKGRQWFYQRCKNCGYDESVTVSTLFHKCKLGLLRVFEMGFDEKARGLSLKSKQLVVLAVEK
ncbi:MAG: transposase [Ferruginibacter sp.]